MNLSPNHVAYATELKHTCDSRNRLKRRIAPPVDWQDSRHITDLLELGELSRPMSVLCSTARMGVHHVYWKPLKARLCGVVYSTERLRVCCYRCNSTFSPFLNALIIGHSSTPSESLAQHHSKFPTYIPFCVAITSTHFASCCQPGQLSRAQLFCLFSTLHVRIRWPIRTMQRISSTGSISLPQETQLTVSSNTSPSRLPRIITWWAIRIARYIWELILPRKIRLAAGIL